MLVKLADVVTGSVADREVIAINDGCDMISLYRRLMSDTDENGGVR